MEILADVPGPVWCFAFVIGIGGLIISAVSAHAMCRIAGSSERMAGAHERLATVAEAEQGQRIQYRGRVWVLEFRFQHVAGHAGPQWYAVEEDPYDRPERETYTYIPEHVANRKALTA